jgi:hypothetical protein
MQPQNRIVGKLTTFITRKLGVEDKENIEENPEAEESVRLTPRSQKKANEIELHENPPSSKDQTTDIIVPDKSGNKNILEIKVEERKDDL